MTKTEQTTDIVKDFQTRLASVLKDLRDNAQKHPEAMRYIGSLASEITQTGGIKTWKELKAALSIEAYNNLLQQCAEQGTKLLKSGDKKSAHAVDVIATSIVASRMQDEQIAKGNVLLDSLINEAIRVYDAAPKKAATKPATLN